MPELPEVETTRRGIAPHIENQTVTGVRISQRKLRWPIPELEQLLPGETIHRVRRRAKYLLLDSAKGTVIIHLGMSGSLRVLPVDTPPQPHDHVDIQFGEQCLRLRDPRRFGAVLWTEQSPAEHPLIQHLGPEPLDGAFNTDYLYAQAQKRKVSIKQLIMDGKVVVGVGNIYATESLFLAGIHPTRPCNRISKKRLHALTEHIKQVLGKAIEQGGTTLRDFQNQDGKPGYFQQQLLVYGRAGEACPSCKTLLKTLQIGQRASSYCPKCQR